MNRKTVSLSLFALASAALLLTLAPAFADSPAAPPLTFAQAMQPFVDNGTIAGTVILAASPDKILSVTPVGYADLATKRPMEANTEFWIASMTKSMTCAAMMILVDEGKVNLDDPVYKYLPEFATDKTWPIVPNSNDKRQEPPFATSDITVREIMSHTGGLRAVSPFEQPTHDIYPLSARVDSYTKMPLLSDPGTEWSYSNAGINTAGRIIEVVSGEPYEKFMHDHILRPLGMNDTTFFPNKEQISRIATSYVFDQQTNVLRPINIDQLKYPLDDPSRQSFPAGGYFSTAADVSKFCQMLINNGVGPHGKRILSQAAVTAMTSDESGPIAKANYGFGLFTSGGGNGYGHNGAYSTLMQIFPNRHLIFVFLVQMAGWNDQQSALMQGFYETEGQYDKLVANWTPSGH